MDRRNAPDLPDPLEVVDAVGDVIMHIPRLPGEIAQRLGAATNRMGGSMESAVGRTTQGEIPDPITFLANGLDYVLSIPRGALEGVEGVFDGAKETFNSAQERLRRLSK